MNNPITITIFLTLVVMAGQGQITLKGSIINERGEKIEYVRVCPYPPHRPSCCHICRKYEFS